MIIQGNVNGKRVSSKDLEAQLQKAVAIRPESADAHFYLGTAQLSVGLPQMARGSFTRALSLNPRMTEAVLALARLSMGDGDVDAAARNIVDYFLAADVELKKIFAPLGRSTELPIGMSDALGVGDKDIADRLSISYVC